MHPAIRRSVYEPGTAAPVFRAGELTFGIVICRDSTYPELVRSLAHRGAVALFVPTNNALPPSKGGPEIVEQARRTDLSLATENGLAVIRADVAGRLDGLESYGSSWIIENSGVTLRAARQLEPDLVVAEIQIQCRSGRYNPQGSGARPKPSPQAFAGSIIMSTRSTTLVEFLAAVVADDATAVRLVGATPQIAQARAVDERLVKEIPHQVYAGDTALHLAAAALRPLTVGALIRAGADSNAVNRRGATALHYACDARPRAGGTWNPSKQRSVIELLLDAGADVEHKDKAGAVPLHRAVRARSPEAVRCLLERGARVDATHGRQRTTPLHIGTRSTGASGTKGAQAEQQEIVGLLLEYGANPRARDANGTLPRIRA